MDIEITDDQGRPPSRREHHTFSPIFILGTNVTRLIFLRNFYTLPIEPSSVWGPSLRN